MASATMNTVYIHVIDDFINKVRDEFINNERPSAQKQPTPGGPPVHDLNVPYEGTEEYETPTADMLFPPTPLQTPIPTPLPGSADGSMYNIPTGSSDYPTPVNDGSNNNDLKGGRPSPYMQSPSWLNQRTPLNVDVNIAYVEGRGEEDRGTSQPLTQGSKCSNLLGKYGSTTTVESKILAPLTRSSSKIPQLDGPIPDPFDEMLSTPNIYNYQGVVNEDYNVANTPAPNDLQAATPVPVAENTAGDDNDEEPLNENDDDDDLDDVDHGEELNTHHLVLAQFDKVTRTKS
ncbi:hypothetical protein V6N12_064815 [Hibiscus sabdariffa]|uniref:Uncharacterized protein n=1 Tax=Hibiscus sabdariffa TaxID=183260 RepID=A0ABR2G774_9ROSI